MGCFAAIFILVFFGAIWIILEMENEVNTKSVVVPFIYEKMIY
jgi:hypothetical protein